MIHHVKLRTFAHATEDVSRVRCALELFLPEDCEIKTTMSKGHFGNPITVLEARLEKRHCKSFLDILRSLSKDQLLGLKDELNRHFDDDCNFYVRFDKQSAYEGDIKLAKTEDSIAAKMKIISYPSRRENAVMFLEGIII
ncbi:MAG: exosome protein [Methanocellales archaeon]|nr:exosome protein [Methanocellales archaeon]